MTTLDIPKALKTPDITSDEQKQIIDLINSLNLPKEKEKLFSKLIHSYERLQYFKNIHNGMWAREFKDEGKIFRIRFDKP